MLSTTLTVITRQGNWGLFATAPFVLQKVQCAFGDLMQQKETFIQLEYNTIY